MTNEQREAIEFLEFYKQHCLKKEIENMDNYETIHDGDFVSKNLDTVLSLIKEKQIETEIYKEELDSIYKALNIERGVARPSTSEIIRALKNTIKSQAKQIDLMARAIDNYDSQLVINTFKDKEHVIQYFAGLVEKE